MRCFRHWFGMCLNERRVSDFLFLATVKMPQWALPHSWSWVSSHGNGIENMATLSAWECGSLLYGPQKLEVYLYPTRSEYEAKKMARVDEELWPRSALSLRQGECGCGCVESQGSLQLFASCVSYWRRVQHLSTTRLVIIQHHPHAYLEEWDYCSSENDEGLGTSREEYKKVTQRLLVFVRMRRAHCGLRINWFLPKKEALNKEILHEAHNSRYSIHMGSIKMYHDLRQQFWWMRMKCETAHYVSECDTCRMVKADYMKPGGLLQPLSIPDWKWDDISMDFIVWLPFTVCKFDSVWVIVDQVTKCADFILVHTKYQVEKYAEIYIAHVLCLHGVSKMIISNRVSQFVACFWE
jgi:hypothetical protein